MWVEPGGILSMPVSIMCVACSWLGRPCVIERTTAQPVGPGRQAAAGARRPCTPGARVAIGLNSPRISAGASGFRSNVSRWLGAPVRKIRITDFALPGPLDAGRGACLAEQRGQPHPQQARIADLDQLAARDPDAVRMSGHLTIHGKGLSKTPPDQASRTGNNGGISAA